ncbi:MAG: sensor domain-containing diguanylate cyclase [Actinomycetota bacterium]|nr:sensor domain-containing diguanylate cyclase [Actinomycetota bacterium]
MNKMLEKILPYIDKILWYTNEIFIIKDTRNNILFVNEKVRDYGYEPESLIGKNYLNLLSPKHKGKRFHEIVNNKKALNYEVEFLRSDGTIVNALATNSPVWDESGKILFVVSTLADITSYKQLQKKLVESTYIDYLTGLYNIRYLYKRLEEEVSRAERKGEKIAIIMFDIDNFKKFNDNYGHENGNKLLKKLGSIIRKNIRKGVDLGFRFGGDEFLIIVNQAGNNVAFEIASRIRENFLDLNYKNLDMSMGIEYYTDNCSIKNLITRVDKKVYIAKRSNEKIIK